MHKRYAKNSGGPCLICKAHETAVCRNAVGQCRHPCYEHRAAIAQSAQSHLCCITSCRTFFPGTHFALAYYTKLKTPQPQRKFPKVQGDLLVRIQGCSIFGQRRKMAGCVVICKSAYIFWSPLVLELLSIQSMFCEVHQIVLKHCDNFLVPIGNAVTSVSVWH